ncbi:RNA pseudouridine synthase [Candidatus Peregrinibacteria bacterium]|nr:RNA pseudouridine synthase [Candidatus Peregrinibacteria bacterium]
MPPILYEDKACFVVNKPAGLVVHPDAGGKYAGKTLVDLMKDKIGDGRLVHRLDKDTSGVLIIAKNNESLENLRMQFKEHKVEKIYLALVKGILEHKEGIIDSPIARRLSDKRKMGVSLDGRRAISHFRVLKEFGDVSLLQVRIETGRMHQIRVHFAAIKHPVVCDDVYGHRKFNAAFVKKYGLERQFLHAWKITFRSLDGGKIVKVEAGLPEGLEEVMGKIKK